MPELLVQITKRADGAVLKCVRSDGTETWQRHHGRKAEFFPLHDLTHYAVESELGFRRGFYGLIADGWDIDDTSGKRARGQLPAEAIAVEHLVGLLDVERSSGATWTVAEFNEQAADFAARGGRPAPGALTEAGLARLRARVLELFECWYALAQGDTLELSLDRSAAD